VTLRADTQRILLSVEDNGPGVPEDELNKLGTPFHRLLTSQPADCGLGLAIVREIARLYWAEVFFCQGAHGQGLQVRIEFHLSIVS
jgi:signal transduction histidine kinase